MKRTARLVNLVAAALVAARSTSADDWISTAGLSFTDVRPGINHDYYGYLLVEQSHTLTTSLGIKRELHSGLFAVGVRAAYMHLDTAEEYYCRFGCALVNPPSRDHIFPITPTVEVSLRRPRFSAYLGGGFGIAWIDDAPGPQPLDAPNSTPFEAFHEWNHQRVILGFAGMRFGSGRARAGVEMAWRSLPSLKINNGIYNTVHTLELGARVDLRR